MKLYIHIICLLLVLISISPVQGHTFVNSSANPAHIFKCQPSTIWGNFSGGSISAVYLVLTSNYGSSIETYNMTANGSGRYNFSYGNSNLTTHGNKSISFIVNDSSVNETNVTSSYVFVYSDPCTGTGITNISIGIGNYTNRLQTGGFLEWFATPYTEYWGDAFYLLMLFVIIGMIYMKNQDISQPILMAFIGLAVLAASTLIPVTFRAPAMLLMGVALAAIYWKVFKS